METLPEQLNVSYVATFNVKAIVQQLREDNRDMGEDLEITLDDILEAVIFGYRDAVMGVKDARIMITDENGDEL